MSVDKLGEKPRLVRPMQQGVWYYMEHAHNRFYVLSNINSNEEFKVIKEITFHTRGGAKFF